MEYRIRVFVYGQLACDTRRASPEILWELLKAFSITPKLVPSKSSELWNEGEQKTQFGSIEWTPEPKENENEPG